MKVKIKNLQPNPFKKYITKGLLSKERIDILKESVEMGTLPEHFYARKNNGVLEVPYGHHRLEALRQVKGKEYEVDITLKAYTDEQILIDMVRENITQRDTDYHDTREGIVLARTWLQSKCQSVKQFNTINVEKGKKGFQSSPTSYRSITTFLSKNGKTISHVTVKNYLDVYDNVKPEIMEKVKKVGGGQTPDDVTVKQAMALSKIPKEEQDDILAAMKREPNGIPHEYIKKYKNAPEEVKQRIREGKALLSDIEEETYKEELKEEAEKRPTTVFLPNFAERMREFNRNVSRLEDQVKVFSEVFRRNDFKERYISLKPKEKKTLHQVITNIEGRIKYCHDEVDFFMKQFDEKELLEE